MNKQTILALIMGIISLIALVHLIRKVVKEWQEPDKRGINIVFVVAILCAIFVGVISFYRIGLDLGLLR